MRFMEPVYVDQHVVYSNGFRQYGDNHRLGQFSFGLAADLQSYRRPLSVVSWGRYWHERRSLRISHRTWPGLCDGKLVNDEPHDHSWRSDIRRHTECRRLRSSAAAGNRLSGTMPHGGHGTSARLGNMWERRRFRFCDERRSLDAFNLHREWIAHYHEWH